MGEPGGLSEREKQVASLLLQGKSNKDIALALGISIRTVEFHLTHIFEKTGATSRTEAIVILSKPDPMRTVGGLITPDLRETPVVFYPDSPQNEKKPIIHFGRQSMKTFAIITTGLLAVLLIVFLEAPRNQAPTPVLPSLTPFTGTETSTPTFPTQTVAPSPSLTPREQIVAEVRRQVAAYDVEVKKELKDGEVEIRADPKTGRQLLFFTGASLDKINTLYGELMSKFQALNQQSLAQYIAEIQPTPFPTQPTDAETEAYYQKLSDQYPSWFDALMQAGPTVDIYDPTQGLYQTMVTGDTYARSEVRMRAMNALHDAPEIAKVNQDAQIAVVQTALDEPDLSLTFQKVERMANATSIETAVYLDNTGTRYWVTIGTNQLAGIQPAETTQINVDPDQARPIDKVRQIALKFATGHSPRYAQMKNELIFRENAKGDLYFYRWEIKNKDWSGTPWAMMPPFLQIGFSADGVLRTYIDTLDLY